MGYLEAAHELYKHASQQVHEELCCTAKPSPLLPGLAIPAQMTAMDYGCGTTVHPGEVRTGDTVLYVGVGGGMEALQFAYVTRRKDSVIAVERVPEMREKARANLALAEQVNPWFRQEYVRIVAGDALALPLENASVDIAAQNCLFNVFKEDDLHKALQEINRVLKPGGRLYISDPVTTSAIPEPLRNDERLRAMCLSGALVFEDYVARIAAAGFGEIQVRARRPYRVLGSARYGIDRDILLETVELVACNVPVPAEGMRCYIGETATYTGPEACFDDGRGHILKAGIPAAVCRREADNLRALGRSDLFITPPTYHHVGTRPEEGNCASCSPG